MSTTAAAPALLTAAEARRIATRAGAAGFPPLADGIGKAPGHALGRLAAGVRHYRAMHRLHIDGSKIILQGPGNYFGRIRRGNPQAGACRAPPA
jgi:hypothetical protein